MGVLCLKWDMLKQNSLLLPVTCYCWVRNADVPSMCLRSAFAMAPLFLRSCDYRINGLTTDLQRNYNEPTLEGAESSQRISLKPVLSLGDGLGMFFTFYIVFHAYWIRWISLKLMLIVMLLRLSAAYTQPYNLHITASLSLSWVVQNYNRASLNKQAKSRPVTGNR